MFSSSAWAVLGTFICHPWCWNMGLALVLRDTIIFKWYCACRYVYVYVQYVCAIPEISRTGMLTASASTTERWGGRKRVQKPGLTDLQKHCHGSFSQHGLGSWEYVPSWAHLPGNHSSNPSQSQLSLFQLPSFRSLATVYWLIDWFLKNQYLAGLKVEAGSRMCELNQFSSSFSPALCGLNPSLAGWPGC